MVRRSLGLILLSLVGLLMVTVGGLALVAVFYAWSGAADLTAIEAEVRAAGAKWSFADYGMEPGEVRGEGFDDWVAAVNRLKKVHNTVHDTVGPVSPQPGGLGAAASLRSGTPQDHGIKEGLTWSDMKEAYAPVREAFAACVQIAESRDISFRPDYDSGVIASFGGISPALDFCRAGNQLAQIELVTDGPASALGTAERLQATLAKADRGPSLSLIEVLVESTKRQAALQTFRDLILVDNLGPAELDRLEALLPTTSLLDSMESAIEGERALNLLWVRDQVRRASPSDLAALGEAMSFSPLRLVYVHIFLDGDIAHAGRLLWNEQQRLRSIAVGRVSPLGSYADGPAVETFWRRDSFPPRILTELLMPSVEPMLRRSFFGETRERQAWIALALERYRRLHGTYPETLGELKLPNERDLRDPVTFQPMRYRRETGDAYTLYSVGWNGTDEGGRVQPREKPEGGFLNEQDADDWLWPRPVHGLPAIGGL